MAALFFRDLSSVQDWKNLPEADVRCRSCRFIMLMAKPRHGSGHGVLLCNLFCVTTCTCRDVEGLDSTYQLYFLEV